MVSNMEIELTTEEARAISGLRRLSSIWPKSLMLFAGGAGLTVRKPQAGQFPDDRYVVADIYGIPADGGDGGRES